MDAVAADLPSARVDWAYFLDVDGTLIDIAETPAAAAVDAALLDLLGRLHRASGGAVALVSGRALADLDRRLGACRLPLAGQHGLERRDAAGRLWIQPAPSGAGRLIRAALEPLLAEHPGLLLEDKGPTLAVHYRQVPHLEARVRATMARLVAQAGEGLVLQEGKCVLEVKPGGVDKGTAIEDYLLELPFRGRRPVFIGDDLNDEHGFAVVNRAQGLSIKVGAGDSCATHRLPDVGAVRAWLAAALEEQS